VARTAGIDRDAGAGDKGERLQNQNVKISTYLTKGSHIVTGSC